VRDRGGPAGGAGQGGDGDHGGHRAPPTVAGVLMSIRGEWSNMASNLACAIVPLIEGPNVAWLGSWVLVWWVLIGAISFCLHSQLYAMGGQKDKQKPLFSAPYSSRVSEKTPG
jgi:hypothetical protein